MFAASLDPKLLRAFKATQRPRRCEVRRLRRSPRLRGGHDATATGWGMAEGVSGVVTVINRYWEKIY
jgi:hypothetical protein